MMAERVDLLPFPHMPLYSDLPALRRLRAARLMSNQVLRSHAFTLITRPPVFSPVAHGMIYPSEERLYLWDLEQNEYCIPGHAP
jgi:hypothetical protein